MPCPGDWSDQPAVVGEAFLVIEAAYAEQAEREHKSRMAAIEARGKAG